MRWDYIELLILCPRIILGNQSDILQGSLSGEDFSTGNGCRFVAGCGNPQVKDRVWLVGKRFHAVFQRRCREFNRLGLPA